MGRLRARGVAWCVAAALAGRVAADDRSSAGEWGPLMTWPVSGTHAILLPTGKVLVIGEFEEGIAQYVWNPADSALTPVEAAGYNVFCAGHSRLADGRIVFSGGHAELHVGIAHAAAFDPATQTWDHLAAIASPRWYPTSVTLASGEVVVISGEIGVEPDPQNPVEEIPILEEIPEVYDPKTNTWRILGGARQRLTYYPWCFVAPDAAVFCVNQNGATFRLDPTGAGRWTRGPWSLGGDRRYGSPALVGTRIFITGGGLPPRDTVEMLDLAAASPRWTARAPMTSVRRQHNATILPDGKILVTGGTSGNAFEDPSSPVLHPEVYDPDADQWTRLAPAGAYRGYHSTALLLPDGRVLSAGGRAIHTAQVFSPPYLFRGARPRIAKAPSGIDLAEVFRVETPDAAAIRKVSLVRLGSVTHSYDEDQRWLPLEFEASDAGLRIKAPASNATAPPGDYMLFLVDAGGVPSEAAILRLGQKTWEPPREDTGLATAPAPSGGGCSSAAPGAAPLLAGGALAAFLLPGAMRRRPPGPRSLRRS